MKKIFYLYLALAMFTKIQAQNVTITPAGITPKNTHPRISYDAILALPSPQEGDLAYDTTYKCLRVYIEGKWLCSYQNPNAFISIIAPIIFAGGTGVDMGQDIAVDNSGNIYLTGTYSGTTTFGAINKTSAGSTDIFIAKYNSSNVLQWVLSAGGPNEDAAQSIAVDANGNVYVTGYHSGEATFESTTLSTYGGKDIFVTKYNSSGALQWVKAAGGEEDDEGKSVAVDAFGNVYLTGSYADYAVFGDYNTTSQGESDIFLTKQNSNGNFLWVKSAGGTAKDQGNEVIVDTNNNLYLTGYYSLTGTFGGTNKTAVGLSDIFVASYSSYGVFQWVQSAGGSADDYGKSLALDGSGNIYVTGYYYGTAIFESTGIGTGIGNTYEIFLAKYNSSGVVQWAQSAGGTGFDNGFGVAVSGNYVYMTGFFSGMATFGTLQVTSKGDYDIFVAKYNNSGVCQGVQSAGGPAQDYGLSVTTDSNGKIYATGYYVGTATFGNTTKTSQGLSDVFVIKLD